MARVFLARSEGPRGFSKNVAIKLLFDNLAADDDTVAQFINEAKIAARIRHPNVVSVHSVQADDFGVYLVMDYVAGLSLASLVARSFECGGLPDEVGVRILADALSGLHAAHELTDESGVHLGIVHRDFTPQNILVGSNGIAQLTDFGVAKILTAPERTRTGVIKGKVRYMAPEQAKGEALDRRCDVWAAGVIAWEMFAKRRLYPGQDDVAMLVSVVTSTPKRLREVNVEVEPKIEEVVAWALAKDRNQRCPDAEQFRRALLDAAKGSCGVADAKLVTEWVERVGSSAELGQQASPLSLDVKGVARGRISGVVPKAAGSERGNEDDRSVLALATKNLAAVPRKHSWLGPLALIVLGAVLAVVAMTFVRRRSPTSAPSSAAEVVSGIDSSAARNAPPSSGPMLVSSSQAPAPSAGSLGSAKGLSTVPLRRKGTASGAKSKPVGKRADTLPPSPYEKK